MNTSGASSHPVRVGVLLVGREGAGREVLASWLRESGPVVVVGTTDSITQGLLLAASQRPEVVLLMSFGLPVTIGYTVALFKELATPPRVCVLSHEVSGAMRRRCQTAGVDAVFDQTSELAGLALWLEGDARATLPASR